MNLEQPIILDTNNDYITTIQKDIFYKHLFTNKGLYIFLSVYKQRCMDLHKHFNNTHKVKLFETPIVDPEIIISTPKLFLSMYEQLDISKSIKYVVLEDPALLDSFGYSETIKSLRAKGLCFIALCSEITPLIFLENPTIINNNFRYTIECTPRECYIVLYTLLKYKLLKGSTLIVCEDELTKTKLAIFLKVFNVKTEVMIYKEFNKKMIYNNLIVMSSKNVESVSENVIWFTTGDVCGYQKYSFDFGRAADVGYRVDDVLRALSPAVLRNKKEFPYYRFRNLKSSFNYSLLRK